MSKEQDNIEAFFKGFAKADEALDFRFASDDLENYSEIESISTGSHVLNDALSSGGLPKGRIIQFYGPPGSSKTLCAMLGIKEAQKQDPSARQLFIDAEQTFDSVWAAKLGIDTKKLMIVSGNAAANGRECFEMLLGVPKEDAKTHEYKGKSKEGLLDKVASGEFNFNMIVLDSIGQIIPPGEDISKVGKMNISLLARFLTTTFRKLTLEVKKANVPFVCVNHKRDNMDPYGPDHTFSGGNTYAHSLSANIYFQMSNSKDKILFDEHNNKVGGTILATVEKSKFGPWPRKCEFNVDFRKGIVDLEKEIAALALKYGIVQKTSSVTHEYKTHKWVGFPKFCDALVSDEKLAEELLLNIAEARRKEIEHIKQSLISESVEEAKKPGRKSKKSQN